MFKNYRPQAHLLFSPIIFSLLETSSSSIARKRIYFSVPLCLSLLETSSRSIARKRALLALIFKEC